MGLKRKKQGRENSKRALLTLDLDQNVKKNTLNGRSLWCRYLTLVT
jgi:hypothetical protein